MKTLDKNNLSKIGFVNKAVGFKGRLSLLTDVAKPESLRKQKFFFLLLEGLPVPFAIEEMEINDSELLVKLEGIDDESQAKKLLRLDVYGEKMKAPEKRSLGGWKELENFTAIDQEYGEIGIILEVQEYPMQMIARALIGEKEVLFPLNEDVVVDIDEAKKSVYLDLPPGLLDIYLK
jgi:16S rRNA processing protein RimM